MDDFGKILDEWENHRPRHGDAGPPDGISEPGDTSSDSMGGWLERYPPPESEYDDFSPHKKPGTRTVRPDKVRVDDTLDLHGFRLEEALAATDLFIERSVEAGCRKVLIIHGKGANGQGVLRQAIRARLEHHRLTGAMGYGRGEEGGRGALWVMLRGGAGRDQGRSVTAPDR